MAWLPDDVARCQGSGSNADGWREGCDDCLRRIAPVAGDRAVWIVAPPIIVFECEYRIEVIDND